MKTLSKRILALATAFVMVLSMLSVGTLSAFAEVDTSGDVIEIGSVADWNEVAAKDLTFENQTVKLTADINKDGEAVELTTLSTDFKGTFDGNGYTIYNVKAEKALIGAQTHNATVQNVKIDGMVLTPSVNSGALIGTANDTNVTNVSVTELKLSAAAKSGKLGGVIGSLNVTASKTVSVSNIKVNATLSYVGNGEENSNGANATGGVIGYASIGDDSKLTIQSCSVEGSISSNESIGAILGYGEPGKVNNTTNMLNCESKMRLTGEAVDSVAAPRAGMGMIGIWRNSSSANLAWIGTLNIENCVNSGTMTSTIGNSDNNKQFSTPGGMLGSICPWRDGCGNGATINIKNCLLTGAVSCASSLKGAMVGSMRNFLNCAINIENCATTQENYNMALGNNYVLTGTTLTLNGQNVDLKDEDGDIDSCGELPVLSTAEAADWVRRDANGYIVSVGKTQVVGYQTANAANGQEFDLRIVAIMNGAYEGYKNVGFKVSATYEGLTEAKTTTQTITMLYNSISAVTNSNTVEYSAEDLGGDYLYVLACKNLPTGVDITFTVTSFYTRADDDTVVTCETDTFTVKTVPSNNMPNVAA